MNQPTADFPALRGPYGHGADRLRGLQLRLANPNAMGIPQPELYLLVRDPTPTFSRPATAKSFGSVHVNELIQRVSLAIGEVSGALKIRSDDTRQCGYIASGWTRFTPHAIAEQFVRKREYTGRVREIDRDQGTFTAILAPSPDDPDSEVLTTFDVRLLDSKQRQRLAVGADFTLVTGYRQTMHESGKVVKTSLATRIFFREPRRLSPGRRRAAHDFADELFDEE